ncbi:hypothetical protein [Cardinium endosymbiont of Dermatophagoides farinae]|uniref:hypothetical protein n=1 Tax=Cardinium endosymbiont of Dermatophagoides farinae TaxID=2597823 RepID=UPI001184143C|nr:hypothetical protein [Cardinium endosymbiont of Dermatophagoides farinae]TSJ81360.1 hypothetical protein FPG78_05245 [Cardinium endosymbiont of Dermatophagoides farinae]
MIFIIGAFLLGANWYNVYWPSFPWFTRYIQYVHTQKYKRATFAEKIAAIDFKVGKWDTPHRAIKIKRLSSNLRASYLLLRISSIFFSPSLLYP